MTRASRGTFAVLLLSFLTLAVTPALLAQPLRSPSAPDLEFRTLEGDTFMLSDLRGEVVVLNFWATWCPPCRHEIPAFIDVQERYADAGVRIIGISMDSKSPEAVATFARKMGVNYDLVMATSEMLERYGEIRTLPSTVFIGRDGTVLGRFSGMLSEAQLEQYVRRATQ